MSSRITLGLCVLFAATTVWLVATRPAMAVNEVDGNRELVVVTGGYANGMEVLYMLDARTRHLAVYRMDNGRALKLVAARDCTYDLMLMSYGDETAADFLPAALRKHWVKYNAEASGSGSPEVLDKEKPSGDGKDKPPAGGR